MRIAAAAALRVFQQRRAQRPFGEHLHARGVGGQRRGPGGGGHAARALLRGVGVGRAQVRLAVAGPAGEAGDGQLAGEQRAQRVAADARGQVRPAALRILRVGRADHGHEGVAAVIGDDHLPVVGLEIQFAQLETQGPARPVPPGKRQPPQARVQEIRIAQRIQAREHHLDAGRAQQLKLRRAARPVALVHRIGDQQHPQLRLRAPGLEQRVGELGGQVPLRLCARGGTQQRVVEDDEVPRVANHLEHLVEDRLAHHLVAVGIGGGDVGNEAHLAGRHRADRAGQVRALRQRLHRLPVRHRQPPGEEHAQHEQAQAPLHEARSSSSPVTASQRSSRPASCVASLR